MGGTLNEDLYVNGTLRMKELVPSASSVLNAHIGAGAAIDPDKMGHLHRKIYSQSGTVAAATIPIHVVNGSTGVIRSVKAGTIALCAGDAAITVDLKNNGTTVLNAVITLNSSNTARVVEAGVVSVDDVVVNDFLEVVVAVNAGTGTLGTGLLVEVEIEEDAL